MGTEIQQQASTGVNHARANGVRSLAVLGLDEVQAYGFLTPELLLQFCQDKIKGLDEQVQRAFVSTRQRTDLSNKLSDLSAALNARKDHLYGGDKSPDPRYATVRDEMLAKFDAAISAAGKDSQLGKDLTAAREHFVKSASEDQGDSDDVVNATEIKNITDTIADHQSALSRDGELEMMQLQSLMSKRQQAFQMCTNMISSIGQSAQQIAANVGK